MQWAETWLSDGDELEIVHFVGGGAAATARNRLVCLPQTPLKLR
jgi:hypothetical protein